MNKYPTQVFCIGIKLTTCGVQGYPDSQWIWLQNKCATPSHLSIESRTWGVAPLWTSSLIKITDSRYLDSGIIQATSKCFSKSTTIKHSFLTSGRLGMSFIYEELRFTRMEGAAQSPSPCGTNPSWETFTTAQTKQATLRNGTHGFVLQWKLQIIPHNHHRFCYLLLCKTLCVKSLVAPSFTFTVRFSLSVHIW